MLIWSVLSPGRWQTTSCWIWCKTLNLIFSKTNFGSTGVYVLSSSLLNCVLCVLKTCSRANVPYVLTCWCANVPCGLTFSRGNVRCVLTCQRVLHAYVLTWQRAFRAYVLTYQRAYVLLCKGAILSNVNSYIVQIC